MRGKAKLPPLQVFEKPQGTRIYRGFNTGKNRVHLDLTPEDYALFQDLTKRMMAGSMILAFRRTLPILEQIVSAIEKGKRPVIIDDELNELEIIEL